MTVGTLVDDLDLRGTLSLLFVLSEDDCHRGGLRVTYFVQSCYFWPGVPWVVRENYEIYDVNK